MTDTKPTRLKDVAERRTDLFHLSPDLLQIREGWNSRDAETPENQAHIESLAVSIAALGVQMPLTITSEGGRYFVTDGHCRLAAVRLAMSRGAEIKSVPVQVQDRRDNEGDRLVGQIVRNSGKNLTPLEQANVFKRLLDFGWSEQDIATKVGKTRVYVSSLLDLRAAPSAVVDMVRKGEVSASLANTVLREQTPEAATAALRAGVESAKAQGKTRATGKHVGRSTPVNTLGAVRRVIRTAEVKPSTINANYVTLTISALNWGVLKETLMLQDAEE